MGKISNKLNRIYTAWSNGDKKNFLYIFFFLPLYLFSLLYGIGVRLRFFLYRIALFKTRKLNCKVISIGNITVGGSGKTPMTIFLAQKFLEKGKKPVILSRGYKGRIKDIGVVSDGESILLTPNQAGDEPYLMAAKLKTVPVIVGKDRYKTGFYAIDRFQPDVILLDDGFQHVRLHRDIDIILIELRKGFGNGYLFPLGILREPLSGLKRATFFMLNGVQPYFEKNSSQIFISLIKGLSKAKPANEIDDCISLFSYKPKTVLNLTDNSRLDLNIVKGKKVLVVSGIANPKSFRYTLEELEVVVVNEIIYPDHHYYTSADVADITKESMDVDIIITTVKDAVKLKSFSIEHLPIYALDIELEIKNLDTFEKTVGLR